MSDLWYVRTAKRDRGPYETAQVLNLAAEGRIQPQTPISRDAKQTWIKAETLSGIEFGTREPAKESSGSQPSSAEPVKAEWDARYGGAPAKRSRDVVGSFGDRLAARGSVTRDRLQYSGICAVTFAAAVYVIVRLLRFFGIIELKTVGMSLFVRIGLPLIAALVAFVGAWFRSRSLYAVPAEITPEMSDEEIARALHGE